MIPSIAAIRHCSCAVQLLAALRDGVSGCISQVQQHGLCVVSDQAPHTELSSYGVSWSKICVLKGGPWPWPWPRWSYLAPRSCISHLLYGDDTQVNGLLSLDGLALSALRGVSKRRLTMDVIEWSPNGMRTILNSRGEQPSDVSNNCQAHGFVHEYVSPSLPVRNLGIYIHWWRVVDEEIVASYFDALRQLHDVLRPLPSAACSTNACLATCSQTPHVL